MLRKIYNKNLTILLLLFGSVLCNNHGSDDRIIFDGPVNYRNYNLRGQLSGLSLESQIALAQELNRFESVKNFVDELQGVPEGEIFSNVSIFSRSEFSERANFELAKPARCEPELQPVSLTNSSYSSSAIVYPSCTRVNRCGGCCGHPLLSCQPTATITKNFQVIVAELDMNLGKYYRNKEIVPIEEHTKCACSCIIKAHHCNEKQNYSESNCRCMCSNVDEEAKCLRNNETKLWDDDKCVCSCRGSTECTTGSYYDHNTCSCKKLTGRGNQDSNIGQNRNRQKYNSDRLPPTYTIGANDPRRRHKEDPE